MIITKTCCDFEREPLKAPFGFKGGYVSQLWQVAAKLCDERHCGIGLGIQSVLWSDAKVFVSRPEAGGNSIMFLMTAFALEKAKAVQWNTPIDLLEQILPEVYDYGRKISDIDDLRLTFALNALVAVDNAAWLLYANNKGINNFDALMPEEFKPSLSGRQKKLAAIPLITYGISTQEIANLIDEGYFFLKIKIGCDPDKDGDLKKMVEWDKKRLTEIHEMAKSRSTPYTDSGKIPYYLDANGRYDSKKRLIELLDHAEKIGALDQIMILEEPFAEEYKENVSDLPVRLAADESAHSDKEALERIELGYGAIALKPIAKTLSVSFKIAKLAAEHGVPCFCADLTVSPIMIEWNKNVATRLAPLPGMKIGVLESNGHQNYKNWDTIQTYHPCYGAPWAKINNGLFELDESFYSCSGGIFMESKHFAEMVIS